MTSAGDETAPEHEQSWRPTVFGKLFTRAKDWSLSIHGETYEVVTAAARESGGAEQLTRLRVEPGAFWATVHLPVGAGASLVVDGIPNEHAADLAASARSAALAVLERRMVAETIRAFDALVEPVVSWALNTRTALLAQLRARGWITKEFTTTHAGLRPRGLPELLSVPGVARHLATCAPQVQEAVEMCRRDFAKYADAINERHLARELIESKAFFDTVEKAPLTEEQARAVLTFDNRVLLVASAGSGKTSTMVAKAGYALKKQYVAPERMLLLAFNNDAAAELRERLKARLERFGLPAEKLVAKTFHAFGLDVIGSATGKRPSLAPWVESGQDVEALMAMADDLKDRDPIFRTEWDLYRVVFGQDLPAFGKEREEPDSWNSTKREQGFWTLNNEVVKSRGEQLIANWLFYNGVVYAYEAPYEKDTADSLHRQYRPDFYLPDCGAYLEHWALNEKGEPPPEFVGYKEGMAWKRRVHSENQTILLETTVAELWSGKAFRYLAEELPKLGVVLDPNPDRPVPGRQPIENPRLARTFRAFLTHTKSNRLTPDTLRARLDAGVAGVFRYRHMLFLSLFAKLTEAWHARLTADKCIDFDDMLNLATDCIENGTYQSPFDLIMVDEFQDASHARARLVAGLVRAPGKHLFAVGDDWQSINRFAGADLGVMTDFEKTFGIAVTLKLETTFRCPQALCDLSSRFVQKNPKQLRKTVRSTRPGSPAPVSVIRVPDETNIRAAVERRVGELAASVGDGHTRTHVYVLGRYRNDATYMPARYDASRVEVTFMTAHSSKGLEADHIIVSRMTAEALGFPSGITDDPVLQLAMPSGDAYPHAEERRLFYVALTRARVSVTLITLAHKESSFVAELVRDEKLAMTDLSGEATQEELCPSCKASFLMPRSGRCGTFYGCASFPRCTYTRNIESASRASERGYGRGRSRRR
jgi:DNA helicase IV